MTENAPNDNGKAEKTSSPVNELTQLRHIIFGQAQANLEHKITNLQTSLDNGLSALSHELNDKMQKLHEQIDQNFASLEDRIQYVDKQQDDKSEKIHNELSNLASEHEMFCATTDKNIEQLNQDFNKETSHLKTEFNQLLDGLRQQLDKVSAELGTSKTDRKTLAKLLSTMANNLEDDEL